jgi:hypothetical protein
MAFEALTTTETGAGKAIIQALMRKIKNNFDALFGILGTLAGSDIPNGSFEVDSTGSGIPDGWTLFTYPGGSVARDIATVAHGEASLKLVHPGGVGNGGGYATSDYVACNQLEKIALKFIHWSTAAGMKNQVIIYWYTAAKVACATPSITIYDSTANPTAATSFVKAPLPPSTARFFKVRVVGGESSVDVAGSAYFDGLELTMTTDQVLYATSVSTLGAVGTEAFLGSQGTNVTYNAGSSYAGSGLKYSGTSTGAYTISAISPAGTWQARGTVSYSGDANEFVSTLFLRIS